VDHRPAGQNQTFVIIPNSYYKMSRLLVDGKEFVECDDEIDMCWIPTQYTFTQRDRTPHHQRPIRPVLHPADHLHHQCKRKHGRQDQSIWERDGEGGQEPDLPDPAHSGYTITELLVDGRSIEECDDEIDMCWIPSQYTFTNVREAGHTIKASFARP